MARTAAEIKEVITKIWKAIPSIKQRYELDENLSFEQQFSKVSLESLLFYAYGVAQANFEKDLDLWAAEIDNIIANMKPHTLLWYINKIKAFQDSPNGEQLLPDSDRYEVIDEEKQIIKYCAISERQGFLYVKAAKQENQVPMPLSPTELERLTGYINRVKDAGVHFEVTSRPADLFKIDVLIHYNALMGLTKEAVINAINEYLQSMPFDGVYSNMALTDKLQTLTNVKVCQIRSAAGKYGDNEWTDIVSLYMPDAGYMKLIDDDESVKIELIPYNYAD